MEPPEHAAASMTAKLPSVVNPTVARFMEVFHPYATKRLIEVHEKNLRFVHYTSAAVAHEIIEKKKVWMRQASCMNDYLEIEHGLDCVAAAYRGDHGQRLKAFLDGKFPGISQEIEKKYDEIQPKLRFETYITCLSEHAGEGFEEEDKYGRLSMWRAYGRGTGVALVMDQSALWETTTQLGIFTTPVAYLDDVSFAEQMGILATNLEANADFLASIGRDVVRDSVVNAFATAAVSTKHPGFKEEREWRVVQMATTGFPCPLEKPIKVISGAPQQVLLIDLAGQAPTSMPSLTVPSLLDRLIIGPTAFPIPQHRAFGRALWEAGIADPWGKIVVSHLPLRTWSA